jgi:hypothetical protein
MTTERQAATTTRPPTPFEVREVLHDLEEVLRAERQAVAHLDTDSLAALAPVKDALLGRLRAIPMRPVLQVELRVAVERLRATARAHAILLREAAQMVTEALGLAPENETYDARARLRGRARSFAEKEA